MTKRRAIGPREILAVDERAIQRDADGIFLLFGPETPENECIDGVSVVHVRGPLDHHRGFGDNYDDIRERMRCAFEDDESTAVVCRLDSPGGVVAGLLDTVRAIRALKEGTDKQAIAYVDESAFSAAYALACAFDEIVLPPSAICGSIGVISTMADQVDADIMSGLNVVTITSGARKADGHPHVRISEAAIAAEKRRVDKLALQFFREVRAARGLPIAKIAGFQARLFLGAEAIAAGTADRVETFDALIARIGQHTSAQNVPLAKAGTSGTSSKEKQVPHGASPMTHRGAILEALKAAKADLAKAKPADKPKLEGKVAGLSAALEMYKKVTEKHVEHSKTHEEDEDEEGEEGADGNETDRSDEPEDDEDDDESDDKKKSAASAPKKSAKRMDSDEEEAESEDDEAEALAAQVRRATGKRGAAAQGAFEALVSKARSADALAARVAKLERDTAIKARDAVVDAALAANRVTKKEAANLRTKAMAHVEAFLEARPKSIIATTEDELLSPAALAGGHAVLPPEMEKMLNAAASATGIGREQFISDYAKSNGIKTGTL